MAEDYDEFIDKTKLTQDIIDKFQSMVDKGVPEKRIKARLDLDEIDGLITTPEHMKGNERDWENDLSLHIIRTILPKMGTKAQATQTTGKVALSEQLNIFLKTLGRTQRYSTQTKLVGGGNLGVNTLKERNFDPKMIDVEKLHLYTKGNENYDIKAAKNQFNFFKKTKALPKPILDNLAELLNFLKQKYVSYKEGEEETRLRFEFIDMPTDSIFSNKKLLDINQRKATYEYWGEVYDKFEKNPKLIGLVKDFSEEYSPAPLKQTQKIPSALNIAVGGFMQAILGKNKTVAEFKESIKKVDSEKALELEDLLTFLEVVERIGSLNYIVEVGHKDVKIKDVEERAMLFIEKFLSHHDRLSSIFDVDDVEMVYDKVTTEEGQKTFAEMEVKDKETFEEQDNVLVEDLEQVTLDPLAIKYLKDDLGELAEFYSDFNNSMLKEIREQFEEFEIFMADREDYEDMKEKLEEALESIEIIDEEKFHLPIFLFNTPALKTYFPEEAGIANKIQEDILKFLDAYSNLLEDEKTFSAQNVSLTLTAGQGTRRLDEYEDYKQYSPSKQGTVRKFRGKLKKAIDAINDYIVELFVKPMHSIHRFGMKLPFEKGIQLRVIASSVDDAGEGYLAYKEISKRIKNFDAKFIDDDAVNATIDFIRIVTGADIYDNADGTYLTSERFVKKIMKVFNKNPKVKKQLIKEVASLYGSLLYVSNKTETLRDFMGEDVKEAFVKNRVDDPEEIQVLQVLTNALREKKETVIEEGGGTIKETTYDTLMSELDRVAKSEIYSKLLEAHDSLRILKGKEIHYARRNENNFDHVEDMLVKMQREHNLDMSAGELVSIINEIDSFDNISKAHGINSEHVYLIKANFR